ncbi:MAG TPA: serine hydrolase domain-containing protein [Stellaceae bacterium]|jgi:CubicO group peptidase (beta-lactamase class C family)
MAGDTGNGGRRGSMRGHAKALVATATMSPAATQTANHVPPDGPFRIGGLSCTDPIPLFGKLSMKAKYSLLLGFALCCLGVPMAMAQTLAGSPPNENPDRLLAIVQAGARKFGTKAVEFGMWVRNREVLTTALGDSMTTVPATTDMHYRIGGIGETFMSTLLLMLVEQGQINLNDRISRWFPHLLAADRVTVRMLVANTAGYIDYVKVKAFLKAQLADPFRTFTDVELINYSVHDGKMNFAPGTSQQYSHTDNVILGQVIQRATKRSMQELYDENIFRRLSMKDTQFPVNQEIQRPVLHAFTADRGFYEDNTYWNPSWGSTPGLPTSNIFDLGRWGPIFGTGGLISRAHFREQIAPTSVGKGKNRPNLYFAYGFVVANGWLVQNPSINGYSGAFGYNLAKGVTIVVEATKSETATTDASAFDIFRNVVKYVTPESPINF